MEKEVADCTKGCVVATSFGILAFGDYHRDIRIHQPSSSVANDLAQLILHVFVCCGNAFCFVPSHNAGDVHNFADSMRAVSEGLCIVYISGL